MTNRLRIARSDPSGYLLNEAGADISEETHRRLRELILRHLPPLTASLLAAPVATADGRYLEWYSDLAGQPVPLTKLPAAEQALVRGRLEDRLASLQALAEQLPTLSPDEADLAGMLRRALRYPGDETVYAVEGQPVLTFWGYRAASGAPPAGPPPSPRSVPGTLAAAGSSAPAGAGVSEGVAGATAAADGAGPRRWPWAALALLLALGLGLWAWWYYRDLAWPPWVDYAAEIAAAQAETDALVARQQSLEAALAERLKRCSLQQQLDAARADEVELLRSMIGLQERLAAALQLCPLRQALQAAAEEQRRLEGRIGDLRSRLTEALDRCRRQQEEERKRAEAEKVRIAKAKAEPPPPPPKPPAAAPKPPEPPPPPAPEPKPSAKGLPPCPGERAPEEAPDMAVVLDASGSMRLPASAGRDVVMKSLLEQVLGLPGGLFSGFSGPSRLQAAQRAVNNVVRSLPSDVDVGLVVLADCPRASEYGFFSGAQRNRLYGSVNGLRPMQKTPLADGILRAGRMVDGVKAPAVIVVVSDGEDTCGGDPCAAARSLKAQKPQLKINVVDIIGDGKSNCIANATGGRVLSPQSGMAFEETINRAAQEAKKPAHCR